MIEQTKSYKTSDGAVHLTLEAAKAAEIVIQVKNKITGPEIESATSSALELLANVVAKNSEVFAEILGKRARKPRKPKSAKPAKAISKTSDAPKP
jgi:aspartate oxidase